MAEQRLSGESRLGPLLAGCVPHDTPSERDHGCMYIRRLSRVLHFPNLVVKPVSFGRDTKTNGPSYLVSMPGEEKDPTQGVNV